MIAAPIIPGRLYRVRGLGQCLVIIASHPCAALAIAAERMLPCAA